MAAEDSRLAVYVVTDDQQRILAETSLDGLGLCLETLCEEREFSGPGARVGVLDTVTHKWIVDPYKGTGFAHV